MTGRKPNRESNKSYQKPKLRTIELAAEEVMANGCHQTNKVSPGEPSNCFVTVCSDRNAS